MRIIVVSISLVGLTRTLGVNVNLRPFCEAWMYGGLGIVRECVTGLTCRNPTAETLSIARGSTCEWEVERERGTGARARFDLDRAAVALDDLLRDREAEPRAVGAAARLVGAQTAFAFKKGGVCRIDFDTIPTASDGHLRWFATPRMLRRLR